MLRRMNSATFAVVLFFGIHFLVGVASAIHPWPSFTNGQLSSASDAKQAIAASHMGQVESKKTGLQPLWQPYMFSGMPGFPLVTTGVPETHPFGTYMIHLVREFFILNLYAHSLLLDVIVVFLCFVPQLYKKIWLA